MNPNKTTAPNKIKSSPEQRETNKSGSWLILVIAIGVLSIIGVATTAYFGSPFGYRLLLPH